MNPFFWPHFFNYFINPQFEPIIQGSIPILAGINYSQTYEGLKKTASSMENVIFYDKDICCLRGESKKDNLEGYIPHFDKEIRMKYMEYYKELNPNKKFPSEIKVKFMNFINKNTMPAEINTPSLNNTQEQSLALQILLTFRELNEILLETIKSIDICSKDYPDNLDYIRSQITNAFPNKKDKLFIEKFANSQILSAFIEKHLLI